MKEHHRESCNKNTQNVIPKRERNRERARLLERRTRNIEAIAQAQEERWPEEQNCGGLQFKGSPLGVKARKTHRWWFDVVLCSGQRMKLRVKCAILVVDENMGLVLVEVLIEEKLCCQLF